MTDFCTIRPEGVSACSCSSLFGQCQGGFTLIELLVVIAIIAILAAMLLPGLSRSKMQAQSTVCMNHLHEMGLALQMYVGDYKAYPYDYDNYDRLWHDDLQPFYPLNWTNPAYHCPAYQGAISVYIDGPLQLGRYGSYSYNVYGAARATLTNNIGVGVSDPILAPRSDSQVIAPGETFAIMDTIPLFPYNYMRGIEKSPDGEGRLYFMGTGWTGWDATGCFWTPVFPGVSLPHGQVFNVLFCDGHLTTVLVTNLFDPTKTARNWNFDHQPHRELWRDQ